MTAGAARTPHFPAILFRSAHEACGGMKPPKEVILIASYSAPDRVLIAPDSAPDRFLIAS